jgi:hypothetical protein
MPTLDRSSILGPHLGELASSSRGNYATTPIYGQPATEQITVPAAPSVSGGPLFRVEFRALGLVVLVNDYSPEGAFEQACRANGIVATAREVSITY